MFTLRRMGKPPHYLRGRDHLQRARWSMYESASDRCRPSGWRAPRTTAEATTARTGRRRDRSRSPPRAIFMGFLWEWV